MDEPQELMDAPETPPELPQDAPEQPEEMEGPAELLEPEKPVSGRSWMATAVVGVLALVVGLFLGYVGRGQYGPEAQAAKATQTFQAGMNATQAAGTQKLMEYLVSNSRHSKGPEDAKVAIIEFSDFQ